MFILITVRNRTINVPKFFDTRKEALNAMCKCVSDYCNGDVYNITIVGNAANVSTANGSLDCYIYEHKQGVQCSQPAASEQSPSYF